jgi:glycolate oxidase
MVLNDLKKIVGEEFVSKESNTKLVYSQDASTQEGHAFAVVWPADVNEVQQIIKLAKTKFMDVVTRGAGTGLVGGAVPKRSIVLNTSRMTKILKIGKNKAVVQSGVILDDLNNELKEKGLFFPVIPASHKVCTIGGMIACNAAGKRAVHYGVTCDWVEYLEIVDGNGRLRKISDVRKFCGSEGILGVIINAQLKLSKLPKKVTLELYKFDNISELTESIMELKNNTHLLSLELLDKITSSMLRLDKRYHLIAEYDNNKGTIRSKDEIREYNNLRDKAYTILAANDYVRIQDPKFTDEEALGEFFKYLESEKIPFFGHVGIGVIHPCLKRDADMKEFYKKVLELKGNVTGEHGIGLVKKKYVSEMMRNRLELYKNNLDPNNVMNRGKVI